jgi:hypothetical protein
MGKQAGLESALKKSKYESRHTSAPETLSIGWRLKGALMTILCDRYLSNNIFCWARVSPSATHNFPLPDRLFSSVTVRLLFFAGNSPARLIFLQTIGDP